VAQINVTINGRNFRMACEDGQEEHLLKLAKDFNARIEGIRAQFGEVGDMRLTIMAAITMADELTDAMQKIRKLEHEISALQDASIVAADRAQAAERAVAAAFNAACERIEAVAKSLGSGLGPPLNGHAAAGGAA